MLHGQLEIDRVETRDQRPLGVPLAFGHRQLEYLPRHLKRQIDHAPRRHPPDEIAGPGRVGLRRSRQIDGHTSESRPNSGGAPPSACAKTAIAPYPGASARAATARQIEARTAERQSQDVIGATPMPRPWRDRRT